jgi:hypothetical protein
MERHQKRKVNILKGNNVVATGKLVELAKPAENNSVTTKALDNNTRALLVSSTTAKHWF